MEMLGQDADRDGFERMVASNQPISRAQRANVLRQQRRAPVKQIDGEKERPAGNEQASVIRHRDKIAGAIRRR